MAIFNRGQRGSTSSEGVSPHGSDPEYGYKESKSGVVGHGEPLTTDADGVAIHNDHTHLHRGLKSRHITMIAIGGAIGTGLIIGTGKALAQSGYVRGRFGPKV
jgi:amino acid transporter